MHTFKSDWNNKTSNYTAKLSIYILKRGNQIASVKQIKQNANMNLQIAKKLESFFCILNFGGFGPSKNLQIIIWFHRCKYELSFSLP